MRNGTVEYLCWSLECTSNYLESDSGFAAKLSVLVFPLCVFVQNSNVSTSTRSGLGWETIFITWMLKYKKGDDIGDVEIKQANQRKKKNKQNWKK